MSDHLQIISQCLFRGSNPPQILEIQFTEGNARLQNILIFVLFNP